MANAFEACHAVTHRWEKGYADHPKDPGGPTQDGVTQAVYDAWRLRAGHGRRHVRHSTEAERLEIYREQYWHAVRGEYLPPGIDLAVYDFAVNSGPTRAIRYLQAALGVTVDGHIGAITLKAARDSWERGEAKLVVMRIMEGREKFLRGLKTFGTFGKGWMNRLEDVGREARRRVDTSRQIGPAATKVPARERSAGDSYAPDKAATAPANPAGRAKTASEIAVATGTIGGAAAAGAAEAKDLMGDLVSPLVLLVIVIMVMVAAGAVAWIASREAKEADA